MVLLYEITNIRQLINLNVWIIDYFTWAKMTDAVAAAASDASVRQ